MINLVKLDRIYNGQFAAKTNPPLAKVFSR